MPCYVLLHGLWASKTKLKLIENRTPQGNIPQFIDDFLVDISSFSYVFFPFSRVCAHFFSLWNYNFTQEFPTQTGRWGKEPCLAIFPNQFSRHLPGSPPAELGPATCASCAVSPAKFSLRCPAASSKISGEGPPRPREAIEWSSKPQWNRDMDGTNMTGGSRNGEIYDSHLSSVK